MNFCCTGNVIHRSGLNIEYGRAAGVCVLREPIRRTCFESGLHKRWRYYAGLLYILIII